MLYAVKDKSREITKVVRKENSLVLYSEHGKHRLAPKNARTIRVTYTGREEFSTVKKNGVIATEVFADWTYEETADSIVVNMPELSVKINRQTGSYMYYAADGSLLLAECPAESKELESFTIYNLLDGSAETEEIQTADGKKHVVKEAKRIPVGESYHTRLKLRFQEDEHIYGLGQQEEGFGSLRGQMVFVHQANRQIAVPMFVSNKGYGILMDTYSPLIFSDTSYGTYLYSEVSGELDFYFMNGDTMAGVIKEYRYLTGKATLLPKWAFGYLQSQERYETQEEVLAVASEYRRRGIGLDGIIQDWISWDGAKWGEKSFDPVRYPEPDRMVEQLHDMDVHFMLSIWANPGETSDDYQEFLNAGFLLPASNIYNAYLPEARKMYWQQAKKGLFDKGVDAWWCDNSEPYTPEWNVQVKPEPVRIYSEYCREVGDHLPPEEMNSYAFYHAMGIYEGQRSTTKEKRVFNLTRSGHTGQQRFGTVLWSGDISATWDTLRRQIAAGLGLCASGLPYWTVDIGAFFIKSGNMWYWKGDYDNTIEDLGYAELFIRWYQWGTFLPIFRGHGTDCRRELWMFEHTPFYEALLAANRLRYELMPYIYSLAGRTWLQDESMMRFLAFDYPTDEVACSIKDQYLFGDSLMVCPVTKPMYYGVNSAVLDGVAKTRPVYLPEGLWYDFYTNKAFNGGRWIEIEADISNIPVFVKAGAILPLAEFKESTAAQKDISEIRVYAGTDGEFTFYTDAGDGYGYEKGEYECATLKWDDKAQKLAMPEEWTKNGKMVKTEIIK